MAQGMSSASGLLALLEEPEPSIQEHALKQLNNVVDIFWPEVADATELIEKLAEDPKFPARQLASLVSAKVYYHLGHLKEAMKFALGAEQLFDLNEPTEFSSTLLSKCIDEFSRIKKSNSKKVLDAKTRAIVQGLPFDESEVDQERLDPRLDAIVDRMFQRCFEENELRQAIGIAVESLRLDIVERAVKACTTPEATRDILSYIFEVATHLVVNREFRSQILSLLVRLYTELSVPDYVNVSRCHVFLNRPEDVADILAKLVTSDDEETLLLAFQLGFELVENATQLFLKKVNDRIPAAVEPPAEGSLSKEQTNINVLHKILSGQATLKFFLEFLYSKNKTDLGILKKIKDLFEPRVSVLHQATVVANAFMHAGTTRDTFLRENLEWLGRATNWAKFLTTASLGVIHKHHLSEAMNVLDPYLPKPGVDASPYTEGGSLFGLGLIHANQGANTVTHYILQCLRNVDSAPMGNGGRQRPGELDEPQKKEIVQHGAALGLGVAAMASGLEDPFEELMSLLLNNDSAVAGEAAGISLGLVMLGSATPRTTDMLNFAHVTQHEKIIRSLGLGLALTMYSLEEKANPMIETLCIDKDPLLRYGGMWTVALAYAGTSNNNAIRKLLHFAVSDVSDDVRRAAVMALGFVLFRRPEQVPKLVHLLAESYNPHVRYGAAMAIGVACAGSGMKEAIELLERLSKDTTHFVRQGAFIALAMVLCEISEKANPKVKVIREAYLKVIGDKHQPQAAKFGAILGLGILDAGGRNCTIALASRSGHLSLTGIVGVFVFLQYWYWYPFQLFLSLAFTPTAIIGINKNLEMPSFKIKSNAKPSLFAYPEVLAAPKEEEVKTVAKAELSITKKAKLRQSRLLRLNSSGALDTMDLEEPSSPPPTDKAAADEKNKENKDDKMDLEKEGEKKKEEKPEPEFEILENPARVTRHQLKHISFDVDERYVPISENVFGIVVLKDLKPEESETLIQSGVPTIGGQEVDENEPEPPPPFEYLG